jgi:NAD(P)-dependent dehydrogenase (short-subunit alcohol dehydrogenase family)
MRNPDAEKELTEYPSVLVHHLDVTDRASIAAAVEEGIYLFGRIDVLINNAGFGQLGLFEATSPESIAEQFAVNLFGVMDVTRFVLPHMRARKRGTIINVSSGAGVYTLPMMSAYSASKFGLEGFTEALSYELAAIGITVKLVIPHGGVANTSFAQRTAQLRAQLPDDASLSAYTPFIQHTDEAFDRMATRVSINAEDVAEAIFNAATDGTDRLRYFIGNDTRGFLNARYEMSDDDYIAYMRSWFKEKQDRG